MGTLLIKQMINILHNPKIDKYNLKILTMYTDSVLILKQYFSH